MSAIEKLCGKCGYPEDDCSCIAFDATWLDDSADDRLSEIHEALASGEAVSRDDVWWMFKSIQSLVRQHTIVLKRLPPAPASESEGRREG